MTRTALTLPALALMLALTMAGCTSAPAAPEAAATTAPTPTPTPTPTPELLTAETAAARYLSAVCVSNKESDDFTKTYDDTAASLETLTGEAAGARDAMQQSARILDDPMFVWPEDIAEDIGHVRDNLLSYAGTLQSMPTAPSREAISGIYFDADATADESAQRVRLRLNLSADTAAGCEAYTQ
jgi:hypothetical protein